MAMLPRLLAVSVTALFFTSLLAQGAGAEQYEIEIQRGVKYGTGGGEDLLLDLATPKGAKGLRGVIVFIHGGGWSGGHRRAHFEHMQAPAKAGYVTATISYRLAPKHRFPAQIEDCKCAIRYLRAHADKLNIDPKRIGAIGFSAGAHLAMMLGTMDPDDGLEGEGGWAGEPSKVQAVVSYFGPTDLTLEYPLRSRAIVSNFIGGSLADKPDEYRRASPITYVNSGDAPMLLFQGTKDVLVPHSQATVMADAMTAAGIPGRIELLIGANHGWGGKQIQRTIATHEAFFGKYLKE